VKQLRLNLRSPTENDVSASERVKAAAKRKQAATETLDEAWQRIFAMKNTPADIERLREVKRAMDAGVIGRHPQDAPKRFSKAEALRLWRELAERQREQKIRELVEKTPANYRLITNEASFLALLDALEHEPIIAVDTETTGVDVYEDKIVGVSLTLPRADLHVYIPMLHDEGEQLASEYVMSGLKPILENESIGKVFHNAVFDIHIFMSHGINAAGLRWDTQTAMHLLNENEESFALKDLATKYLREPSDTFETLFGKDAKFNTVPLAVALVYAAKDTHLTWRLYEFQRHHLSKMPTILKYYEEVEVPLLYAVIDMERTGFLIDTEYAKQYGEEMRLDIEAREKALKEKLGNINLNSPAQLKPALERIVGSKLESTDAKKVLKPLKAQFPVIAELLEYKELVKLYSTYISVLPDLIHPKTGRLHARFNPMGARTGRFSSGGNGVNLQNQPKSARKLFVAPEGWVILGGDFSQQEIRCAAYFTQEPVLLDAYEKGKDVYATMAADFYGKPYEECGDGTPERKAMKTGVLAALYGTGPTTLSQQLGCSVDEAKDFLDKFFAKHAHVKRWIDETKAFCQRNGFVWMDKQQRKRRLPEAKKRTFGYDAEVARALRQGPNAVIQGTSAIQTKTTLVKLHELCKRKGWKLLATIHDEVLLLVPETVTREDIAEFERVMIESYRFGNVKNKTDIEIMRRWGEGVSVEEWFANK
jgi:DNA polymerase I